MLQDLHLLSVFIALGAALGMLHFAGLWITVRRIPEAGRPLGLALWSFLARTAAVAAGLALLADGRWERLIAALGGFILARTILVRRLGRSGPGP